MRPARVRIVVDDEEDSGNLTSIAGKLNWFIRRRIARSGDRPTEFIYSTDDEKTNIHWSRTTDLASSTSS